MYIMSGNIFALYSGQIKQINICTMLIFLFVMRTLKNLFDEILKVATHC